MAITGSKMQLASLLVTSDLFYSNVTGVASTVSWEHPAQCATGPTANKACLSQVRFSPHPGKTRPVSRFYNLFSLLRKLKVLSPQKPLQSQANLAGYLPGRFLPHNGPLFPFPRLFWACSSFSSCKPLLRIFRAIVPGWDMETWGWGVTKEPRLRGSQI